MKINPIMNPNILKSYQATKPAVQQKSNSDTKACEVTFSDEARSFQKVMTDVRGSVAAENKTQAERARINEITEAVRQGRYRIDSDKIAEKMLGSIVLG